MKMNKFTRRSKPRPPTDEGPSEPAYLAGHILTEAIHADVPPTTAPNPEELERTADDQRQSPFLRLPIEIRRYIYDDVFEDAGLTQHVYVKDGRYTHTRCITDHDGPDERQVEVGKIYPQENRSFHHPVWSRRLLSSWANHWRCEEAAVAAAEEGPPTPTPFWTLLLCCKRTYLDCRQPLYERLTFVIHRVETALDFLSIPAIAPDIRSLHISLQLDIRRYLADSTEAPPKLPWHGRASAWHQLRNLLPELVHLRSLDVWLDAAAQSSRCSLLRDGKVFEVDARLMPFMRVSIPMEEWGGKYHPLGIDSRKGVFCRGIAEYWQDLHIAPEISWYPSYIFARLYERPVNHGGRIYIHYRHRGVWRTFIEDAPRGFFRWLARR